MSNYIAVNGKTNAGNVLLYALSTCVWCKKTRKLLDSLDINYSYIYVDLLEGEDLAQVERNITEVNPQISFPTIVINGKTVITGFDEEKIVKELGK